MNRQPALSAITPVLNGESFVHRCYEALRAQTFADWEWIVVDDGSTDDTASLVSAIDDSRVRLISYPRNMGRGYARSRAIEACMGDWMVVWDMDDLYFPDRLEEINQARLEGYDYFCSYAVIVDAELNVKGTRGFVVTSRFLPLNFVHPTLGVRMELARSIGYELLNIGEDHLLNIKLLVNHRGKFFDDALTIYQEGQNLSLQKAIDNNYHHFQAVQRLYREGVLPLSALSFVRLAAKWFVRRIVLNLLRLSPSLYLHSVKRRTFGQKAEGWTLSEERVRFIEHLRSIDSHSPAQQLDVSGSESGVCAE